MNLIDENDRVVIAFSEAIEQILFAVENIVTNCKPLLNGEHYLTDREASDKLKLSRRTLQDYRDKGILPFYRLEGKVLYKGSDIQKILDANYCSICKK